MAKKRRLEITIETSLLVIRRSTNKPVLCAECSTPVQLITVDEAALLVRTGQCGIADLIAQGQLRFVKTEDGQCLICPKSLPISIFNEGEQL